MMRRRARAALALAAAALSAAAEAAPGIEAVDLSGVVMSLALVVGFILAAAFVVRRTPFGAMGRRSGELKVVAALPLGPRERLLLVQARGEELLIAVSPAGVFNVKAGPAPRPEPAADPAPVFTLPQS
jgi:flagellar protein FliO/FliZ